MLTINTNLEEHEIIEAYRCAERLKPAEMARALGVSRQRLHSWRLGISVPSITFLKSISRDNSEWTGDLARDLLAKRAAALTAVEA